MKEYDFTQIPVWGSYISDCEIKGHLESKSKERWQIISIQTIAPIMDKDNIGSRTQAGSFNLFWERDMVTEKKPITPTPTPVQDERVEYWKKIHIKGRL